MFLSGNSFLSFTKLALPVFFDPKENRRKRKDKKTISVLS